MFVTGLVLAAGSSNRMGRPKQLLPFRGETLLDATLRTARACDFDQLVVTLGGAADQIRERVDLVGVDIAENPAFGTGCSSSIARALSDVDTRAGGIVLMLGDQPNVSPDSVRALVATSGPSTVGICRYRDGLGHPFWFGRDIFDDLTGLHGDKGVWKLLESGRHQVTEVATPGDVPIDVDTSEDYERLLAVDAERASR